MNIEQVIITRLRHQLALGADRRDMIEDFARIPVEVEYASEFRYRNPVSTPGRSAS
jgi:glutamine---fructose-6-phosphate transaminase (isomerizing)